MRLPAHWRDVLVEVARVFVFEAIVVSVAWTRPTFRLWLWWYLEGGEIAPR
jgi:hypothetical protein